jgi:uncharacterized membrane protein
MVSLFLQCDSISTIRSSLYLKCKSIFYNIDVSNGASAATRHRFGDLRRTKFWNMLFQYNHRPNLLGFLQRLRRNVVTISFALLLIFGTSYSAEAVSGGRMGGGSFKSSSSSSRSMGGGGRTSTLSRPSTGTGSDHRHYTPYKTSGTLSRPIIINSFSGHRGWYAPTYDTSMIQTRMAIKDIAILTGTGMILAYGFRHNQRRNSGDDDGPLGPGYTVGSLTVALDLPNRSDSNNILNKLSQLALSADTVTRKGLQDLLSSVTLELLRQEQAIKSAYTQSKQYPISGQAEREFQILSVASQRKVDRLTGKLLSGDHRDSFHLLFFVELRIIWLSS